MFDSIEFFTTTVQFQYLTLPGKDNIDYFSKHFINQSESQRNEFTIVIVKKIIATQSFKTKCLVYGSYLQRN